MRALNEGGSTALGPALAVAVGMLKKQPGSEVVLCTDGQPNQGVGSLNSYGSRGNNGDFYTKVRFDQAMTAVSPRQNCHVPRTGVHIPHFV